MADEAIEPDAGLYALAAKSKAMGLDIKLIVAGTGKMGAPDISHTWACARADRFSRFLDKWASDPARHSSVIYSYGRTAYHGYGEGPTEHLAAPMSRPDGKRDDKSANVDVIALDETTAALSRLLGDATHRKPSPKTSRDVVKDKAIAAIVRLVDKASESTALEALSAPDEASTLINFLASSEVAGILAGETRDPLAAATARGVAQRKALLEAEGGTASGQEMAEMLGISRQAVDKRRRSETLLAVPNGSNDWRYPRWQILGHRVLPGFERVMTAFGPKGAWTKLHFLLSPNERLDNERPIDLLRRGELNRVIESVVALSEEGAR